MTAPAVLPLNGVRVVDCSRLLPCAYGSQLLADLGAEVIKVEQPGGELGRHHDRFPTVNRHKLSVTLDLKTDDGRQHLKELLASAEVLLESFRPGVMESWGLGFAWAHDHFPRLVYVSSTGYSDDSSTPSRPGHDLNYLAAAGALQARLEDEPVMSALPVGDLATGMMTALATLAGVVHARSTGQGQHVTTSMADIAVAFAAVGAGVLPPLPGITPATLRTWPDVPLGNFPCYGIYRTADRRFIALGNIEAKFWEEFLSVVGLHQLVDDQFATGDRAARAIAAIARVVESRTMAAWEEAFNGREVCFAPVRTLRESMATPDVLERHLVDVVDTDLLIAAFPASFSATPPKRGGVAPTPGEHNQLLLRQR